MPAVRDADDSRPRSVQRLERERLAQQAALDAAKSLAERNRMGQFATPPALADQVVQAAIAALPADAPLRFLDPAFGTGAFYSALLRGFGSRVTSATAFEIDEHYGRPAQSLWSATGLNLHVADFAAAAPSGELDVTGAATHAERGSLGDEWKFNLVVCNPPYVRHHHLTADQKRRLRSKVVARTGVSLHGLAGLYCHFLLLSQAWMAAEGIAAWLIPSEFMDVNYGAAVKRFLLERTTLLSIHRFDPAEAQFDDALVSSAVVLFRNSAPPADHSVRCTFGGSLLQPRESADVKSDELARAAKWTRFPTGRTVAFASARPPASAAESPIGLVRLGDLFRIQRGLATGANSFFILTSEQVARWAIPREFLRPILPGPRLLTGDEIEADSEGLPLVEPQRFLLDCRLPPCEVRARHPAMWEYLRHGEAAGVAGRYLCRHRDPWYSQEQRPPAPFLFTYMGRGAGDRGPFRVIFNRSQATAANVYLLLYPRPGLAEALACEPTLARRVWRALQEASRGVAAEGRVYGGGLHKLEPRELANAPGERVLDALPPAVQGSIVARQSGRTP